MNKPILNMNYHTWTYNYGKYLLYIVETPTNYEFYVGYESYGLITHDFGTVKKSDGLEDFIDLCFWDQNLKDAIRCFDEMYFENEGEYPE